MRVRTRSAEKFHNSELIPDVKEAIKGMVSCDLCGQEFTNPYQLGPHRRVCWAHLYGDGTADFSTGDYSSGNDYSENCDDDAENVSTEVESGII